MKIGMTENRYAICLLAGAILIGSASHPSVVHADSPDDILVIANKGVSNTTLTTDELRSIFLKQRKNWNGGAKIIPIHAPEGSDLRHHFQKLVLSMAPEEELIYWFAQQARGKGGPPIEFRKTQKAVFKISGSVSYVYRKEFKEGVAKVLIVIPTK